VSPASAAATQRMTCPQRLVFNRRLKLLPGSVRKRRLRNADGAFVAI
jgi:hypothetical protein